MVEQKNNIYIKLMRAREQFQKENIKKSGKNKFANYEYYELSDIVPAINKILLELKLCSVASFFTDHATLTITDTEKPADTIVFSSPIAEANLKGCHPIQNLGAVHTYLRRYLYVLAFEIVEPDVLDATTGDKKSYNKPKWGKPEAEKLVIDINEAGAEIDWIKALEPYNVKRISDLSTEQMDEIRKEYINESK